MAGTCVTSVKVSLLWVLTLNALGVLRLKSSLSGHEALLGPRRSSSWR